MNLKFFNDDVLMCPVCNGHYLHHGRIEVFVRDTEDSDDGKHVTVDTTGWSDCDGEMNNNPSCRRGGILIHFNCENCHVKSVLSIAQHKGESILNMGIINTSISYT